MSRPRRKPTPGKGLGLLMSVLTATYTPRVIAPLETLNKHSNFQTLQFQNRAQPKKGRKNRRLAGHGVLSPDAVRRIAVFSLIVAAFGCKHEPKVDSVAPKSSLTASAPAAPASAAPASSGLTLDDGGTPSPAASDTPGSKRGDVPAPDARHYRWLGADNLKFPAPVDSLEARFPTPPGYQRVAVEPGSFGEWLRGLPLAAPNTPVLNNSGDTVYPGDD